MSFERAIILTLLVLVIFLGLCCWNANKINTKNGFNEPSIERLIREEIKYRDSYIALTLEEATQKAEKDGFVVKFKERDGKSIGHLDVAEPLAGVITAWLTTQTGSNGKEYVYDASFSGETGRFWQVDELRKQGVDTLRMYKDAKYRRKIHNDARYEKIFK